MQKYATKYDNLAYHKKTNIGGKVQKKIIQKLVIGH